ncbi:jmjC domain-containing protein 8 isoform X1 [Salmo trutta]|uniref:jmjC domain-containing protein 8 isoform X1 n=1 Tax=Salmo trutta TaxID=8032 RepID=UPI001130047B|nr:jmjC domain-containing protein 8-like isoform X1 [Salmo trutta]
MEYKFGIQVFLLLFWRSALDALVSENDGGWSSNSEYSLTDEGPCNIDIWDKASLSHHQFIQQYAYSKPVILKGFSDNTKFQFLCSKSSLLQQYGERMALCISSGTTTSLSGTLCLRTTRHHATCCLTPRGPTASGSQAQEQVYPSIGMDLATLRSSMAGSAGSCNPRTMRPISTTLSWVRHIPLPA